jgi:hypothetical protein
LALKKEFHNEFRMRSEVLADWGFALSPDWNLRSWINNQHKYGLSWAFGKPLKGHQCQHPLTNTD